MMLELSGVHAHYGPICALQGIDLVENAQAALHHQAQLPARAAGQAVHKF